MPILPNHVKWCALVLRRRLWFAGHQDKIIKSFNMEYELLSQKLGSKEREDVFIIYDILD